MLHPQPVVLLQHPAFPRVLALVTVMCLALTALPSPASAAYVPADGSWGPRVTVPFDPFFGTSSSVLANNHTGGALSAGYQYQAPSANLYASFYTLQSGWGGGVLVSASGLNSWNTPAAALADDGTALLAWVRSPVTNSTVFASLFSPGSGWSTPYNLTGAPGQFNLPSAALDENGNAVVAWSENVSGVWQARYRMFAPASGWSAPALLDTDANDGTSPAKLLPGPSGGFLATWEALYSTNYTARFSRYAPAAGWSSPFNVTGSPRPYVSDLSFSSSPDGTLLFTWLTSDDLNYYNASARRYTPSGGWDPVHALTTSGFAYGTPTGAVDPGGNATVAYVEVDANGTAIMGSRHEPGSGWTPGVRIGYTDSSAAPAAVGDGRGGATVAWGRQDVFGNQVAYVRYVPGSGWSVPGAVAGTPDPGQMTLAQLSSDRVLLLVSYATAESYLFTRFDTEAPSLSITGPADGATVSDASVIVSGTTEPGAHVLVNGVGAFVADDGTWTARVVLGPGLNPYSVEASDTAGNTVRLTRSVTFDDPVPGLEAQLAEAQANLTAAQASLAQAQADLAAEQANLATLEASASANAAQLAQLQAQVAAMNASGSGAVRLGAAQDGTALLIAILGVGLGAAGLALGFPAMMRRRPGEP